MLVSGGGPPLDQTQSAVASTSPLVPPEANPTPGFHGQCQSLAPTIAPPLPVFTMPFMGQIPQIPPFTGEGRASGDSFSEWHEHFENIARLAGWDEHWKLVHLTSNLRDTAMAFY